MKTRINFLDNLRTFLIFLVIVMHSGIIYSSLLESSWIVSDPLKIESMGLLIMYLDIFVMFALFFISGYFIPNSLKRNNSWGFIGSKFKRLMIPWILAVFTLIPIYKAIFLHSRGLAQEEWYTYFHVFDRAGANLGYFADNPTQSWLWFLPVLFLFQIMYLILAKTNILSVKISLRTAVISIFVIGVIYSMLISSIGLRGWFDTPVLHFQRERLLIYFLVFLLGSLCNKLNVFVSKNKNTRLYIISNVAFTLALSAFTVLALNYFFNMIDPERNYSFVSPLMDGILYYSAMLISMFSILYIMIHLFRFRINISNNILSELRRNSYSVYILHAIVMGIIAMALMGLFIPAIIKFSIVILLTFLVSNLIVSGYRAVFQKVLSRNILSKAILPAAVLLTIVIYAKQGGSAGTQLASPSLEQEISAPNIGLHTAVVQGNLEAVKQHIKAGSDLDISEPSGGSSPLITASVFGKVEIARVLVEAGANVNFKNNEGSTALHSAAFFCYPEIVELLLDNGADKSIRNNSGSTALESVTAPFELVKGIYEYFANTLGPLGLELDYEQIQSIRPKIAELLQRNS